MANMARSIRYSASNQLLIQCENDCDLPASHCFSLEAFPNVTFRITAYRMRVVDGAYLNKAKLWMIDPTPNGTKWTVSWTTQFGEEGGFQGKLLKGDKKNFTYNGDDYYIEAADIFLGNCTCVLTSTIDVLVHDYKTLATIQADALDEHAICQDLAKMCNDDELCDCTIAVPKANREFKASQWLLSARSPVFRQMFATNMQEAQSKRASIADFDADVVKQFLHYVHTDSIDSSLEVSARELLLIADKYDVRGLINLAQKRLIKSLSVETVCATFELATLIVSAEALRAACSDYICNNRKADKSKGG